MGMEALLMRETKRKKNKKKVLSSAEKAPQCFVDKSKVKVFFLSLLFWKSTMFHMVRDGQDQP